jgi:hypothetical protein
MYPSLEKWYQDFKENAKEKPNERQVSDSISGNK